MMEQLVNFVIRPPRADYSPSLDLLEHEFLLKGRKYTRKDLQVLNGRGHVLQCSHYMPQSLPEDEPLPCVIYCHGNSIKLLLSSFFWCSCECFRQLEEVIMPGKEMKGKNSSTICNLKY